MELEAKVESNSRLTRMRAHAGRVVAKRQTAMAMRQKTALSTMLILESLCSGAGARGQMVSISVRQQPQ